MVFTYKRERERDYEVVCISFLVSFISGVLLFDVYCILFVIALLESNASYAIDYQLKHLEKLV